MENNKKESQNENQNESQLEGQKKNWFKLKYSKPAIVISLLLVISLCVSLFLYFDTVNRSNAELALIEEARRKFAEAQQTQTPEPTSLPIVTEQPSAKPSEKAPTPKPEPTPKVVRPEFVKLMEEYDNQDIVGHLKIDGTTVDYLVVQSEDNAFYLDRDINKKPAAAGWIFLDYENDITRDDPNQIIYGHNMRAQVMFHDLRSYVEEDYFKEHRYINFSTLYEDQVWEIFSFYITDTSFNYIKVLFDDYDQFFELAEEMKSRSSYDTGIEIKEGDRVLTLSTCTGYSGPETRFVINARLVSPEDLAEKELEKELIDIE